jgi:hypothetical protein
MGNLMLTKFFKKIMGIDKLEQQLIDTKTAIDEATKLADQKANEITLAENKANIALEQEESAKLAPKDRATRLKEPWVGVLNTHINKDNIRNGFFELDWNDQFVLKLKQEGYGFDGDKDEEIVDRWFRELCANVVVDGDFGGAVNTGVIDINDVRKKNL